MYLLWSVFSALQRNTSWVSVLSFACIINLIFVINIFNYRYHYFHTDFSTYAHDSPSLAKRQTTAEPGRPQSKVLLTSLTMEIEKCDSPWWVKVGTPVRQCKPVSPSDGIHRQSSYPDHITLSFPFKPHIQIWLEYAYSTISNHNTAENHGAFEIQPAA